MRQNAKTDVVKDFYKLMNNSDFGNDCRNNTDNYSFTALFYENKDLTFAEKYQIFFDRNISEFVSSELLKRQIQEEFANKLAALDSQGEYYEKNSLEVQKMKELNSVFSMKKSRQKAHTKDLVKDIEEKIREEESDLKTKTRNEYDQCLVCSVKLLPVKKKKKNNNNVTPTTRFFSGKIFVFAKISLISFISDMLKTFCFTSEKPKKFSKNA